MSLDDKFDAACAQIRKFTKKPPEATLLDIYALYKQATVGDVNVAVKPSGDAKSKAKFEAWKGTKGMQQKLARERYIAKVQELAHTYDK